VSAAATVAVCASPLWTAPDAPRPVDGPVVADEPDHARWVAHMDRSARLDLHGRVDTQVLFGEPVLVLDERGSWSEIVAPWQPTGTDERGYRGWVRSAHLEPGRPEVPDGAETAVVTSPSATLRHPTGEYLVSWATRLPVRERTTDLVIVDAPRLAQGWFDRTAVVLEPSGTVSNGTSAAVVDGARQFLGLQYLWAGLTGWGLDCSGLVHGAYRSFGVVVPRDAHDQRRVVEMVPLDEVRVGDLYFFGRDTERITHVGFATSSASDPVRTMLHAPEDSVRVTDEPLAPERRATLVGAGRVAMQATSGTRPAWS
jgi:cell wall-associated NlpC family hydrolase